MKFFNHNIKRICRLSLLASVGLLSGCVAEEMGVEGCPDKPDTRGEYYLSLNVVAPSAAGTRAQTGTGGNSVDEEDNDLTVAGTVSESTLNDARVYLCVGNEVKAELSAYTLTAGTEEGSYKLSAKIESLDDLLALAGEDIQILVAGNTGAAGYSPNLRKGGAGSNTDDASKAVFSITGVDTAPLGGFGQEGKTMPLVNASDFTFKYDKVEGDEDATLGNLLGLFDTRKDDGNYYEIKGRTLDLERAVARIEFKDKGGRSEAGEEDPGEVPGQSEEEGISEADDGEGPGAGDNGETEEDDSIKAIEDMLKAAYTYQVGENDWVLKLESMQLFNVNKNSYLFRHAASGTEEGATGESEIFGIEKGAGPGYSWISNPDWVYSGTDDPEEDPEEGGDAERNSVIDDDGEEGGGEGDAEAAESYTKSPDFLNGLKTTLTPYEIDGAGAKITIEEFENNKAANKYQDPDGTGYYPWCYVSENTIPSKALMAETAIGDDDKEVAVLAKYATGIAFRFVLLDKRGEPLKADTDDTYKPEGITSAGDNKDDGAIRLTDPSNGGEYIEIAPDAEDGCYYLTYYAFIKHNDPAKNTLDPMEYAVVRNNTYQLSINSIGSLPFPEKPESYFLSMEIRVLAWARRDITVSW